MESRRDFDIVAADWDEHPPRVKLIGDIAATLLTQVVPTPEMDVLDFGCGTGLLSLHLASRVRSLTGIDSSSAMLEVLRQKAVRHGLANVKTMHLDPDRGDVISGQYDLVASSMVFHHIQDIELVLRQLHAVIKPSGTLCIADLDPDDGLFHEDPTGVFHSGFDRDGLRGMLKQAGFHDVRDVLAAETTKPIAAGGERRFTVFLMTGRWD